MLKPSRGREVELTWEELQAFEELGGGLANLLGSVEDTLAVASRLRRHEPIRQLVTVLGWLADNLHEQGADKGFWSDLDALMIRAGSAHARSEG